LLRFSIPFAPAGAFGREIAIHARTLHLPRFALFPNRADGMRLMRSDGLTAALRIASVITVPISCLVALDAAPRSLPISRALSADGLACVFRLFLFPASTLPKLFSEV